jgi:catechol 2,3-dioxygenase-like lactoylglutathione lyase family enzyme
MFHHVAIATRDLPATHAFYTEAMGFELVKAVAGVTDQPGGWAKHLFYDTGGDGLLAFWELHDETIPETWSPAISTGLGLPTWVNHLAFGATDVDDIARRRQRWLDHGHTVSEIDHGWCTSIYTLDPNGILVEFCTTTVEFTDDDRQRALDVLANPSPDVESAPKGKLYRPAVLGPVSQT